MASPMVKTSVTVATADLAAARRLGVNVSALFREALRTRLREEILDQEVEAYSTAFSNWIEGDWDHLAAEGLVADEDV